MIKYDMSFNIQGPPKTIAEQQIIVQRIDSIDCKIGYEYNFLLKIRALKQGLMQDLLTGKKEVVPDPEDYKEVTCV